MIQKLGENRRQRLAQIGRHVIVKISQARRRERRAKPRRKIGLLLIVRGRLARFVEFDDFEATGVLPGPRLETREAEAPSQAPVKPGLSKEEQQSLALCGLFKLGLVAPSPSITAL